jgi:Integrase
MSDVFEFIKNRLRPLSLANELSGLVLDRIGKPARRRSTGTKIARDTQRHHLQRIVFLIESVQKSSTPVAHLKEINRSHFVIMVNSILVRARTPGTLDNWITTLNRLARDLKQHHLQTSSNLVRKSVGLEHRRRACVVSKSPKDSEKIKEIIANLEESDVRVSAILSILYVLPLRVREAMCLNLARARQQAIENQRFHLTMGVKNGRARWVPIWRADQLEALENFSHLANNKFGSLIPEEFDLASYTRHFYRTIRAVGLRRSAGLNCHSLRHAGLQDLFCHTTGLPAPINAIGSLDLKQNDPLLTRGYQIVTEAAGHADATKATSYLGSKRIARHGLPTYLAKLNSFEGKK